jgi:hypothetical protein
MAKLKLTSAWVEASTQVTLDALQGISTDTAYGKACAEALEAAWLTVTLQPQGSAEKVTSADLEKAHQEHGAKMEAAVKIMNSMSPEELAAVRVSATAPKPE